MAHLSLKTVDGLIIDVEYQLPMAELTPEESAAGSFDFHTPASPGHVSVPYRAFMHAAGFLGCQDVVRVMERASYRTGEGGPPLVLMYGEAEAEALARAQRACTWVADVLHGRGGPYPQAQRVLALVASVKEKLDSADAIHTPLYNYLSRPALLQEARAFSLQLAVKLANWEPNTMRQAPHLREAEHLALLGYEVESASLPERVLTKVVQHLLSEALQAR